MVKVVNLHHDKDVQGIFIGRPSVLGNPFSHLPRTTAQFKTETREEAVERYAEWLEEQLKINQKVKDEMNRLYLIAKKEDLVLICYCYPKPCHGDIIKNKLEEHL